ncbi:hypothetical protein FN846DRAFT_970098 [Sphaerosporella brunnea]|uniref:Cytochrome oxidase c assembly-domain-containing protein n=1 Tax=Sphaerosporella brunnea TaxID=1250544 RepID=A0A5J5EJH4_9PEZI|nr:hypothetical protein FN846DRAFT_970098 [Sphaerosporella brunnea]
MPRTVADATRFTPTGPYAFTAGDGGGAETPQQRVARLRDAARKARAEKAAGSLLDRVLERGRVWADRAHRVTAVGLMAATVLCAGVTLYAVSDMVMFTRRKKAEHAAAMKAQGLDPARRQNVDVAVIDAAPLPPALAATTTTTTTNEAKNRNEIEIAPLQGPWAKFKTWAMSGMTPADQEYKTAFEKEAEEAERKRLSQAAAPAPAPAPRAEEEAKGKGWWRWSGR